jgi:FkbM family methyltransferase
LIFPFKNGDFHATLFGKSWYGMDSSSVNYLFKEIFIKQEYRVDNLPTNPVIFDCGSNIGTSILYFKKIYPSAKIIGFEANPSVYQLLEKNILHQGLTDVAVFPIALYNQDTELTFFTSSKNENLTGSILHKRGGERAIQVKAQKLSQFFAPYEKVDVVKIDVEGAEWNILEDLVASQTLKKTQNYLIEYHLNIRGEQGDLSQFIKIFEDHGYGYSIRGKFGRPGEFQDLFFHFFKKA